MRSRDIYRQTIQQTAAPRDVEYRLIAQVTSALIECEEIVDQAAADPRKMARLVEALNAKREKARAKKARQKAMKAEKKAVDSALDLKADKSDLANLPSADQLKDLEELAMGEDEGATQYSRWTAAAWLLERVHKEYQKQPEQIVEVNVDNRQLSVVQLMKELENTDQEIKELIARPVIDLDEE